MSKIDQNEPRKGPKKVQNVQNRPHRKKKGSQKGHIERKNRTIPHILKNMTLRNLKKEFA